MSLFHIEQLSSQDILEVSAIHMAELPNDFLPSLGKEFLDTVFYPSVIQSEHADVFVAKDAGQVVGFAVITLESGKFLASMILRRAWKFFLTGLRYSMSGVNHLKKSFEILTASLHSDRFSSFGEIYVIAVRKDKQGLGAGKALVSEAIHYLKKNGSGGIRIKTLKKNEAWIHFFLSRGWDLVDEFNLIQNEYVVLALKFSD